MYVCRERYERDEKHREKTERAEKDILKGRQRGTPNKLHRRIRFNSTAETSVCARALHKNKQKRCANSNSSNHENVRDTFLAEDKETTTEVQ